VPESSEPAKRVLLVEDDPINRALLRAVLATTDTPELQGAQLIEAETLTQARAALAGGQADIVLLDVQLPDGSGLILAREISAAATQQRPVIIALSAGVLPAQRRAALDAGCQAFIDKPYTGPQLMDVLMTHMPPSPQAAPSVPSPQAEPAAGRGE
jgi:CheY-like chemotaxis protein